MVHDTQSPMTTPGTAQSRPWIRDDLAYMAPMAVFLAFIWVGGLLVYPKSLGACIIAHATTNLLLGLYVL
jgi:hypothetical protein